MSLRGTLRRDVRQAVRSSIVEGGGTTIFSSRTGTLGLLTPVAAAGVRRFRDYENNWRPAKENQLRQNGMREEVNLMSHSENLQGSGGYTLGKIGAGIVPVFTSNYAQGPKLGMTADRLIFDAVSSGGWSYILKNTDLTALGSKGITSVYIKLLSGDPITIGVEVVTNLTDYVSLSVADGWKRISSAGTIDNSSTQRLRFVVKTQFGTSSTRADVLLSGAQVEDSTDRAEPTIPYDYVSTNVLSDPWHGANVDGTRYSPHLNGNTVTDNVVTEALGAQIAVTPPQHVELSGNDKSYVSSPDAASFPTGDIELIGRMQLPDYSSGELQSLAGKYNTTGAERSCRVYLNAGGGMVFFAGDDGNFNSDDLISTDGGAGFVNGTEYWWKVGWVAATGTPTFRYAAASDTVPPNSAFAVIPSTGSTASRSIYNSTSEIEIGSINAGDLQKAIGKIFRTIIKDGIDGTVVSDFNPADGSWQTPKTLTSSATGEVHTIHGDAYLDTAAVPKIYKGREGYFGEGVAEELSGRSAEPENWTGDTTAASVRNAKGVDGRPSSASTITDDSTSVSERRLENVSIISGTSEYFIMFRVAYDAAPVTYSRLFMLLTGGSSTVGQSAVLDQSDGTYTEPTSQGEVVSVERDGDFWNVLLKATDTDSGNDNMQGAVYPVWNTDGSTSVNVSAQGFVVAQSVEFFKDFYSRSPMLTTGGSPVTRPTDVGATAPLSVFNDAQGAVSFVLTPYSNSLGGSSEGIISTRTDNSLFLASFSSIAGRINLFDSVNITVVNSAYSSGSSSNIKLRYGNGTMRISANGVLGAVGTYDASFNPLNFITLLLGLRLGAAIDDIVFYPEDPGDVWLQ